VPELLDDVSGFILPEIEDSLRDVRRANIFGLGTWVVKHHLGRLLNESAQRGAEEPAGAVPYGARTLRILDVGTGSADIPQALCAWGPQVGADFDVVATDISDTILHVARDRISTVGLSRKIRFLACDAAQLPFGTGEFDYVTCSLAFHHLDLRQARLALREMARVARSGFIVNDIYRAQGAWYMASILARLPTTSWMTRHDGPASVRRAYTPAEMRRLSNSAGVRVTIYRHPFWRMAAVGRRSMDDGQ
jgi:2-polyprenyl-3-methyl-5-hydroxy-6-metoxy-1,4-benzoquinol methylase